MSQRRMEQKRVLVTGSGTGIGREIGLEFARQGAAVAFHYAHSDRGAASAVNEILAAGGKARAFKAEFTDVTQVQSLAAQAVEFLGGLDVLVNNSGITMNMPFEKVTPQQFDTLYQVNVRGQFFLTQAALPALLKGNSPAVVNLTSVHAFEGMAQHALYAGTKGAIVAYTRSLAIELAPRGIRVNGIAPGAVPVENWSKSGLEMDASAFGDAIPAGFAGTPLDIARVAVFLASDEARYILGQTLIVDGGTTSWMPFNNGFKQSFDAQFGRGYVPGL